MAPFDIVAVLGKLAGYLVYLVIGVGFGMALEMSGFGDSRKLSAQFYFKDMTVLKVMFTAIVVAMVLIFAFSSVGLLDFSRLYVNPTYLWPGIIGGLIMGVGFIVGGFCPGTSLVAAATWKIDGLFFVVGVAFGTFVFGESLPNFTGFFNSSYMGRFIIPDLLGIGAGLTVLLVVLMALTMFYWAELGELFFGQKMAWKEIPKHPTNARKVMASAALVFAGLFVLFSGQPTPGQKWNWIKDKEEPRLTAREVYIHPGELVEVMNDPMLYCTILDIRSESDFNLFHLENARRIDFNDVYDRLFVKGLSEVPSNTVIVLVSNGETDATRAYKLLKAQGVMNLYILSGGINQWLSFFPPDAASVVPASTQPAASGQVKDESLGYIFKIALGASHKSSNPGDIKSLEQRGVTFDRKVKIQKKKVLSGGCG